ncbi:MAG: M81 family metallopeptidase [Alphaproteobacteria bacterium]|nr:M81 family metallopeptidase [Alphaproteobacteria bacterium]
MARIAIAGFMHETNCFVPEPTDYQHFARPPDRAGILRGEEILLEFAEQGASSAGFIAGNDGNHQLAPLLWTSTTPGGMVTAHAYERISGEIIGRLSDVLPVDGVYLDLHGAMVSAQHADAEGELLRRVRAVVGEDVPIVISLDYHANVSPAMVEHADAILPYRTYPHVDQFETGQRASDAMKRLLIEGRPSGRALRQLPFLLPLNFQCTLVEPSKGIVEAAAKRQTEEMLSLAYLAGFPPSDAPACGITVSAHAYSQEAADAAVDDIAQMIALKEAEFAQPLLSPDEAVVEAMRLAAAASKPIVVADTQDNPGCGGSGDTVGMLAALVANDAQDALFGVVEDDLAAAAAHEAGVGAEIELDLGGRTALAGVAPFQGRFRVEVINQGRYQTTGPVAQGKAYDVGPSALLSIGGVKVAISSRRVQAHDRSVFEHLGVVLEEQKIIVLKSTCHYRAHFDPIAETTFAAIAPGGHAANPADCPYEKLRPGVRYYPLGPVHEGNDR